MIKVLRSRQWTFAGVSIVILLFIGLIIYGAQNYLKLDTTISRTVFLEGEYSVDGGEWKPTNGYDPINERFHKITFKGKMSDFAAILSENITISSQNVWYTTKTSDVDIGSGSLYDDSDPAPLLPVYHDHVLLKIQS